MRISPRVLRLMQTSNLHVAVFCCGLSLSAFGATLLDLAEVYHTTSDKISLTITTRAVGSVFGGLIGNVIFARMNTQLVLATCISASGLSVILTPILEQLIYLHAANFIGGMTMSLTEIGAHVWIQVLWRERSGPVLQLYNLIFGVGGIIAPLICEPFLNPLVQGRVLQSNHTLGIATDQEPTSPDSHSRIAIAYAIMGSVFLANVFGILFSYFIDRTNPVPEKSPESKSAELPKKMRYTILLLATAYISLGVVTEVGLASYIPTFVLRSEGLNFTKSSAAYLSSVFWISYTLSRVIIVGLSFVVKVSKLITVFQCILLIASMLMTAFVKNSTFMAWAGTILLGFGLAPCFGNGTVWAVQYITLTHNCMSVIMVSICMGAVLPAVIVGKFIETEPMSLMYGQTSVVILLSLCALGMLSYGRNPRLREQYRRRRTGIPNAVVMEKLREVEDAQ